MMTSLKQALTLLFTLTGSRLEYATSTSIKMDFLPLGDVRTDPIITQTCLSDHVHTFYGVNKMRPETTYQDLRAATGNTGNVQENKSLYWHPTVYSVDPDTDIHTKVDIYFGSAYYIWNTGQATAFPDGFQMIAGALPNGKANPLARANAECVGPSQCERDNCSTTSKFFPKKACAELEVSMAFPTCWDGDSLTSSDQSHVSYDTDGGAFDGDCPTGWTKLPEVQFFFRIQPYSGGKHVFADGSDVYHADYFSGWDVNELQTVLDECENYSEAPNPDAWCEDHLTFRDAPKETGDENIVSRLTSLQPPPFDTTTITDEVADGVTSLPRGTCTGTLKDEDGGGGGGGDDGGDDECQQGKWKKFFFKRKNGKDIIKNCNWLEKKSATKKANICRKKKKSNDEFGPPKDVCFVSCGTGPCAASDSKGFIFE